MPVKLSCIKDVCSQKNIKFVKFQILKVRTMRLLPSVKKTFLICEFVLVFFTASCEQIFTADTFPVPYAGSLAFDGEHFWLSTKNSVIFKINLSGEVIDYIDISIGDITGITFDGENLWAAVWSDPAMMYKIDRTGSILDSFEMSFPCIPRDLAFDGTYFLLFNGFNEKIYRFNTEGMVVDSFWLPEKISFSVFTCDENFLWFASSVTLGQINYAKISKITLDGIVQETFFYPIKYTRISGLAFGNNRLWCSKYTHPEGYFLMRTDVKSNIDGI